MSCLMAYCGFVAVSAVEMLPQDSPLVHRNFKQGHVCSVTEALNVVPEVPQLHPVTDSVFNGLLRLAIEFDRKTHQ